MSPETPSPISSPSLRRRTTASHFREAALIIGLCLVYAVVSGIVGNGSKAAAIENAERLIAFESGLGLFWEAGWNRWLVEAGKWAAVSFNWVYILTFVAAIPASALAYYVAARDRYFQYRNVVVISLLFALVVHAIFPVAPPRMMAEYGFVDTMKSFGPGWYDMRDVVGFFNAYAAMPSLHFAWSIVFGWLFFTQGGRLLKALGVVYPTITFVAIIVTGNHYFVDAAAGAAMMVVANGVVFNWRVFTLRARMATAALTGRREAVKSEG